MAGIQLRSPSFSDRAPMPNRLARNGENHSPALDWSDVPDDAAELALICEDPDAPGGTFVHWVVAGIDPQMSGVREGELPSGAVVGENSFGDVDYDGPMPPPGDGPHRYVFHLYATKEPLGFKNGDSADTLRSALQRNELASGTLVGTYEL